MAVFDADFQAFKRASLRVARAPTRATRPNHGHNTPGCGTLTVQGIRGTVIISAVVRIWGTIFLLIGAAFLLPLLLGWEVLSPELALQIQSTPSLAPLSIYLAANAITHLFFGLALLEVGPPWMNERRAWWFSIHVIQVFGNLAIGCAQLFEPVTNHGFLASLVLVGGIGIVAFGFENSLAPDDDDDEELEEDETSSEFEQNWLSVFFQAASGLVVAGAVIVAWMTMAFGFLAYFVKALGRGVIYDESPPVAMFGEIAAVFELTWIYLVVFPVAILAVIGFFGLVGWIATRSFKDISDDGAILDPEAFEQAFVAVDSYSENLEKPRHYNAISITMFFSWVVVWLGPAFLVWHLGNQVTASWEYHFSQKYTDFLLIQFGFTISLVPVFIAFALLGLSAIYFIERISKSLEVYLTLETIQQLGGYPYRLYLRHHGADALRNMDVEKFAIFTSRRIYFYCFSWGAAFALLAAPFLYLDYRFYSVATPTSLEVVDYWTTNSEVFLPDAIDKIEIGCTISDEGSARLHYEVFSGERELVDLERAHRFREKLDVLMKIDRNHGEAGVKLIDETIVEDRRHCSQQIEESYDPQKSKLILQIFRLPTLGGHL